MKSIYNEEFINVCLISDVHNSGLKDQCELLFPNCKVDIFQSSFDFFNNCDKLNNYDIVAYTSIYGGSIWASEKTRTMNVGISSRHKKRVTSGYLYYDRNKTANVVRKVDVVSSKDGYVEHEFTMPMEEKMSHEVSIISNLIELHNSYNEVKRKKRTSL